MAIIPGSSSRLDLTICIPGFSSSYSSAAAAAAAVAGGDHQDQLGGATYGYGMMRDLDINRVPSSAESVEDDQDHDRNHDHDHDGQSSINGFDDGLGIGGGTRKKLRLSKEQSRLLEESFKHNHTLNPKQKEALAMQLKLKARQVEVWFQNRRARSKLKQTEMECEYLKRWFGSLTEQNRRLQREVEELRAMKVCPPTVISPHSCDPRPASTLSMCPRCQRVTTKKVPSSSPTPSRSTTPLSPEAGTPALQSR